MLLGYQRGDEVGTPGYMQVVVGCTFQRERKNLLVEQIDTGMKGTKKGIVGVS